MPNMTNVQEITPVEDKDPISLAGDVLDEIGAAPHDFALHARLLYDLNKKIVEFQESRAHMGGLEGFFWQMGESMPAFVTDALYQKRATLVSLAGMIALGWIAGGMLSTFLGLLGMGGEILRPLGVFCAMWISELLSAHPGARRGLLALLGLGGLAGFSSRLVSGMLRITSPAGLYRALFGQAGRPSIFKGVYMVIGAAVMYVLISKKVVALDLPAFRESLLAQVHERVRLLEAICGELRELERRRQTDDDSDNADVLRDICPRDSCRLAGDVLRHLEAMPSGLRRFFAESLACVGYSADSPEQEFIFWNSDEHSGLYDTIGLVSEGDRCLILERACTKDGSVTRGKVQKAVLQTSNTKSDANENTGH